MNASDRVAGPEASGASLVRPAVLATIVALLSTACAARQPAPEAPSADQIPDLRAELKENPGSVRARIRLGAAYREADQLESARRLLEEARRRDRNNARAAFFLGLTYEDLGRYGDARDVYRDYLENAGDTQLRSRIEQRLSYLKRREMEASVKEALQREEELADRPPPENTVAVFPFLYRGESPEFEPLSRALAAFLVTDLARSDRITVLERMRVQLLLNELELSQSEYVDPATAVRSGRMLGTSRVVQGGLGGTEQSLEVETLVVDAAAPQPEAPEPAFSGERSASRLLDLQTEMAFAVFRSLGVELTAAERQRVRDRPTANLQALIAFGRGLMAEDSANFSGAARHYRRASQLDPGFEQAEQKAEEASDISAAAEQSTDQLAQAAHGEPERVERTEVVGTDDFDDGTSGGPGRDPVAEALGVEGVSESSAGLRILIPPPGGGG